MEGRIVYKLKNVIRGWSNFFLDIFSDIKYREEFAKRMDICRTCDHNIMGICDICGCVLKAKTKAEDESCPDRRWMEI